MGRGTARSVGLRLAFREQLLYPILLRLRKGHNFNHNYGIYNQFMSNGICAIFEKHRDFLQLRSLVVLLGWEHEVQDTDDQVYEDYSDAETDPSIIFDHTAEMVELLVTAESLHHTTHHRRCRRSQVVGKRYLQDNDRPMGEEQSIV